MLDGLSPQACRELERALIAHTSQLSSARDRRRGELGALSEMLHELALPAGGSYTLVQQIDYDRNRPLDAPRGALLTERYGGWRKACRAAYSMLPDGRPRGPSNPWPGQRRHPNNHRPYTYDEVIAAVRRCALELACRPSSTTYMRWVERKRQHAHTLGVDPRIPTINTVYRHFHDTRDDRRRWQRIVVTAAITDQQLTDAFTTRIGLDDVHLTVADELDHDSWNLLLGAGLTAPSIELLRSGQAHELVLPQAVIAARTLDCSLDYLSGHTTERGRPPHENTRFDHERYQQRRREVGINAERIRDTLQLLPREARQLALGRYQPRLRELAVLEQLLRLPHRRLLAG